MQIGYAKKKDEAMPAAKEVRAKRKNKKAKPTTIPNPNYSEIEEIKEDKNFQVGDYVYFLHYTSQCIPEILHGVIKTFLVDPVGIVIESGNKSYTYMYNDYRFIRPIELLKDEIHLALQYINIVMTVNDRLKKIREELESRFSV